MAYKVQSCDLFGDWIAENPDGLSYICDHTSCDLPSVPMPELMDFLIVRRVWVSLLSNVVQSWGCSRVIVLVREERELLVSEMTYD